MFQSNPAKTWLLRLKGEDNATMLMRAISAAQKACDYIRVAKEKDVENETDVRTVVDETEQQTVAQSN